ncbi:MAG: hypothetical protein R3C05_17780 [Pirellulaceae bacterium]
MLGIFGIIVSLSLLMTLAYRGINVLVLAPLMASLAVLLGGEGDLLATYTQIFMRSLGNYLVQYFPLFMLGAIFGRLMDDSGSAKAISHAIVHRLGNERAILAIIASAPCSPMAGSLCSLLLLLFTPSPRPCFVYPIRRSD